MTKKTRPHVIISSAQKALRIPRRRIGRLIDFVSRREGMPVAQIDLAVVASREMASHNRRFLGHAGDTDIITFDLSDATLPGLCAQLIICGDVAVRQARLHGLRPQHELLLYVVHGLLHLMSYDDTSIRAAAKMHARQDELLKEFLAQDKRRQA